MAENKIPLLTREHQQGSKEEANRFAVVHAKPHDKRIRLHYTTTMEETQVKDCYTCPHCGANLDHGERCDCEKCIDRDAPKPRKRPQPYMGGYNYQRKDGHRYDASCP